MVVVLVGTLVVVVGRLEVGLVGTLVAVVDRLEVGASIELVVVVVAKMRKKRKI